MGQKLGGDAGEALLRNLLNAKHHGLLPLLNFTLTEVLHDPYNSNKIRMTRLWKCFRRVCLMQR